MIYTNLIRPISKKGIPSNYWVLLSIMRNGEIYTRKEMIKIAGTKAVRLLLEDDLISHIDYSGLYAISARGHAYFKMFKPIDAPVVFDSKNVKYWELKLFYVLENTKPEFVTTTKVFVYNTLRDAKKMACSLIKKMSVVRIQITPY